MATPTPIQGSDPLASAPVWVVAPLLVALLALLAGAVVVGYRRGALMTPGAMRRLPTAGVDWLVTVLVELAAAAATRLRQVWATIGRAAASARTAAESAARPATGSAVGRGFVLRLAAAVRGLFAALAATLWRSDDGRTAGAKTDRSADVSPGAAAKAAPAPETSGEEFDIRAAWGWLANRTAARNARPRTPNEIARDAVEVGYPAESVRALLRAFRDVTYGGHALTADRRDAARQAYERLRAAESRDAGGE